MNGKKACSAFHDSIRAVIACYQQALLKSSQSRIHIFIDAPGGDGALLLVMAGCGVWNRVA